jgi:hypothetical protein
MYTDEGYMGVLTPFLRCYAEFSSSLACSRHDRRGGPSLHREGSGAAVRGFARAEHGGLRLLPVAGLPAHAPPEGDPHPEAVPPGRGPTGRLSQSATDPDQTDRLGADPPAARLHGPLRHRGPARDRRIIHG